jgi:hypothetical protein
MSKNNETIETWLQTPFSASENPDQIIWDPGFDAERRLVVSRLGPYFKLFLRPAKFIKHFYHSVYPLLIESWKLSSQTKLYDGFCTMDAELDIRFQATLKYAEKNMEVLSQINQHIKSVYGGLLIDILDKELLTLVDGAWVQNGLNSVERQIENAINEMLMVKNIQCRTLCSLKPSFEEFPEDEAIDGRFAQESVYLSIIKKNFEFREKKAQEEFRQEQQFELEKLQHKRRMLEQLNDEDEIVRLKQSMEAENTNRQLEEQKQQLAEKFAVEERLHQEKIKHTIRLQEAEMEKLKTQQLKNQQIEQEMLAEKLNHQSQIKETETDEEIKEYEKQQQKWNQAKQHLQEEKSKLEAQLNQQKWEAEFNVEEKQQLEKQRLQEQLREEQLKHEARIKEMELAAETEEQEKRHETTQKTEDFLRREIELLVLEKQRAELNEQIKKAR